MKNEVQRARASATCSASPDAVRRELERRRSTLTRHNSELTVGLCVSYGGREDIVEAARRLARAGAQAGEIDPSTIDQPQFAAAARHRRDSRSRSADPHQRRDAHLQLLPLADSPTPSCTSPRRCGRTSASRRSSTLSCTTSSAERRFGLTSEQQERGRAGAAR